jgi:hypothetical protein
MIGKGAQYLTAAGYGRYRITAASLGRDWMIKPWLNGVTQRAIMDAFGVDGTAVIRATNEYLNGIAASDKAKATALAGFINEDPMMVCSLGLEPQGVTMPIRTLRSSGSQYMDSGYVFEHAYDNAAIEMQVGQLNTSASCWCGCEMGGSRHYFIFQQNNNVNLWHMGNNGVAITASTTDGVPHIWKIDSQSGTAKVYKDGVEKLSRSVSNVSCTNTFGLFCDHTPTYNQFATIRLGYAKIWDGGTLQKWFVPFLNGSNLEMIDLVASMASGTKTYAARTGTFVENIVNPDGIPWTPTP